MYVRIHKDMEDSYNILKKELIKLYKNKNKSFDKINIVCIGSSKVNWDNLGPLIGTSLQKKFKKNNFIKIHGTLENSVNALNLEEIIEIIKKEENSLTIAIDACIGVASEPEDIIIQDIAIKPGEAVGKNLNTIGDISILGIINTYSNSFSYEELFLTTNPSVVYNLSKKIAKGLKSALHIIIKENSEKKQIN